MNNGQERSHFSRQSSEQVSPYIRNTFDKFLEDPIAMKEATVGNWSQHPHQRWAFEEAKAFWDSVLQDPRFVDFHTNYKSPESSDGVKGLLKDLIWGVMQEYATAQNPQKLLQEVRERQAVNNC